MEQQKGGNNSSTSAVLARENGLEEGSRASSSLLGTLGRVCFRHHCQFVLVRGGVAGGKGSDGGGRAAVARKGEGQAVGKWRGKRR